MNDAVFNTILSVAMMCSNHVVNGGISGGSDGFPEGPYQPGFEPCVTVVEMVRTESKKRAAAKAAEAERQSKERLANAIAALQGKDFNPESAPAPPKSPWGNCTIVPALSDIHPL
jgi:hypothetical protein